MKVSECMTAAPLTCAPSTPLPLVARMMADHDWAAIPVVESGRLVGIITDRDIACRAVPVVKDVAASRVSDFMSRPVLTISPEQTFDDAAELMAGNHIHHLPVISADGRIVGMLAESDLGKYMSNREFGALARGVSIRRRFPFPSDAGAMVRL